MKRMLESVSGVFAGVMCCMVSLTYGADYCYVQAPSWTSNTSQVRLSLFISLRESQNGMCGDISRHALQTYVAVGWIIDKLNKGLIPGIRFDVKLYDDCQNPLYVVRNALDVVSPSLSGIINCTQDDPSLHLGIIGPSRSVTALEAAKILSDSGIPMISPSATAADLTLNYTNFYRTALPDTVQIRPILDILKALDWTYVALVHSNDIYGRSAASLLKVEGRKNGICFIKSVEVSANVDRPDLFAELRQVKEATEDKHLAVVYFGLRDVAKDIITYYAESKMTGFYWLMSDSVGRVYDIFNGNDRVALGALTLSPPPVEFDELNVFWTNIKDSTPLFREYGRQANSGELFATQSDYVAATVDATYAYAVALKDAISRLCKDTSEPLCAAVVQEVRENRLGNYLKKVDVNFTALPETFVPSEYVSQRRQFTFKKETGDILRGSETVLYHVNAVTSGNQFVNVGNYSSRGLELNLTSVVMKDGDKIMSGSSLPRSICQGYCKECVEFGTMPMVFVKGDVYLVGIFSIHSSDQDNPFKCDKFRSVSSDTIALEAFLYSVEEMRKTTGIKFGAVAFDDCYSSVRLTSIISEYFSSIDGPTQRFGNLVPLNQTVAVIGSLSSDSTIPLARFFNGLNIPVLSYAASSPDLDDRVNFPNFLRTVPSDVEQAKAMVQIILEMGWEYVSLLYVSNNYGTKGMLAFQKHALAAGICVSNPKNISESSSNGVDRELLDVLDEILIEDAQVVVFFGIDTRFKDFMKAVNDQEQYGKFVVVASEDWGNKQNILDSGQRATRGAITLKIQQMLEPPIPGFSESLLSKTPTNNQQNPWFKEFWQSQFNCNLRGGFNNIKDRECPDTNSLTSENMKNHLDNQRVKHVQYATYAAGIGVSKVKATLCRDFGDVFPCRFYYDSLYRSRVWETIREVKNPQSQLQPLFDKDGNGAIGFTIYNVQAEVSGQTYVEVGSYGGSGLQLEKDKIKFYDHLGYPSVISAKCSRSLCSACVLPTPTGSPVVPPSQTGPDTTFRVADIIIIVIFALFLILLLVALLIAYRYLRIKVTGLSKDIQRYAAVNNEHIYQTVSERRVYQNPASSPRRRTPTTPNHIYFVNGSHDSLNEPGGHVNQAFRADDTLSQRNASGGTSTSAGNMNSTGSSSQSRPVETPDTRQRSTSLSPSYSGHVEMTDIRNRVLPDGHAVHENGHISSVVVPNVLQQRPSTLQFHQNPRFTDIREMTDNGQTSNVPTHSMSPAVSRPDLHHLPETFMGSPLSSVSPLSDSVIDTNSSVSHGPLSQHTSPALTSSPSILQSLANQQVLLEQQAALTALEVQRLHLLQQQGIQSPSHTYIPLSTAETRPPLPPLPDQQQFSPGDQPRDRPRPRTNPQHMAPLSSRSHHGSVDSLRSSGRSRHQVSPIRNPTGENIQMQPLSHDSRISRV